MGAVRVTGPLPSGPETAADLDDYRAVPYLLVIESVERDGTWWRRAAYPELPGCVVEAESALEAVERLDRERLRLIEERWRRGEPIPRPRPPLRSGYSGGG